MTPEIKADRWQTIDRLFHSTLSCAQGKRAGFLSQACGDDEALRVEVESLLRAHEQDGSFLDLPAYEVAADFLADAFGRLFAGQQIGPYKIISPLAVGGMGEVYLAQDSRLGRKIALKLLPPDFAKDQHRVRRFAQEARAASALNHPNVCVIHEVGKTSDGRHFIAMELIEGITLRERISRGPLSLADAFAVAEQVAAALTVAHAAGVVHRDIKPENIMLRKDGYVKVLDFGLAKLNDSHSGRNNINEDSTIAHVHTEPGTQMGTVRYMSPEHLRERPVDERADIWSFGVVLHEMITGVTPFEARTRNEVVALILKRQPAKLRFLDDVPLEFQQLVAKALSKNREQRYQTVSELAADLKRLRLELLGETSAEPLSMADQNAAVPGRVVKKTSLESATRHKPKPQTHGASDTWKSALTYISHTAEQVLSEIKGHPKTTVFAGLIAVFALLIVVPRIPWSRNQPQTVAPFQTIKMAPLTNAGHSVCAAISPDGKLFAHAEKKGGMQELLVTSIGNPGTSVVVPLGDFKYRGITFSRDDSDLYFTRSAGNSDVSALYQVALPGSAPRKLVDGVDSAISFSPTGDRFAFVRWHRAIREYSLMIANVDGSDPQTIATRKDANTLLVGPTWSPDGRTIVCAAGSWNKGYHANLIQFDLESRREKPLSGQQWGAVLQAAWLEDGSGLIVSAQERALSPIQLWRVSYPQGESVRITNDTNNYDTVSISRDGNMIVSVQGRPEGKIWVAPGGDAHNAKAIASTIDRGWGLDWTSNGRIVFSSMAGNNLHISSIGSDGSNPIQLTNVADNYTPATTPDGRFIVFASYRGGSLNIWRMNAADGSDPRQLTFTDGNSYPSCSPDGKWVFYDNQSNYPFTVWKVPIDGGEAQRLTDKYTRMPVVSPDGQFMACRYLAEEGGSGEIAIFRSDGGDPIERLPIPVMDWQRIQWKPEGRTVTYVDTADGVANIWSYDLANRSKKQLTHFKTDDQIFAYGWSPDFKQLASLRGTEIRDVTLITNQK
jgi:eukaryotic-like serine/threonine-protein kinase